MKTMLRWLIFGMKVLFLKLWVLVSGRQKAITLFWLLSNFHRNLGYQKLGSLGSSMEHKGMYAINNSFFQQIVIENP